MTEPEDRLLKCMIFDQEIGMDPHAKRRGP